MYITRFTRVTGSTEDYYYHTQEEAESHLNLFRNDDSGLYRNIAVLDDSSTVLTLLPFASGAPQAILHIGDKVCYREEWSSPEERKYIFEIRNMNEYSENTVIACLNSLMTLTPTEIVKFEMIQPAVLN